MRGRTRLGRAVRVRRRVLTGAPIAAARRQRVAVRGRCRVRHALPPARNGPERAAPARAHDRSGRVTHKPYQRATARESRIRRVVGALLNETLTVRRAWEHGSSAMHMTCTLARGHRALGHDRTRARWLGGPPLRAAAVRGAEPAVRTRSSSTVCSCGNLISTVYDYRRRAHAYTTPASRRSLCNDNTRRADLDPLHIHASTQP